MNSFLFRSSGNHLQLSAGDIAERQAAVAKFQFEHTALPAEGFLPDGIKIAGKSAVLTAGLRVKVSYLLILSVFQDMNDL